MPNDSHDTIVQLGNTTVVVEHGATTSRFSVRTASLSLVPGRRPVRLRLEGGTGSVTIEISRIAFWRLTAEFHEQSIAADLADAKQPSARKRGSHR